MLGGAKNMNIFLLMGIIITLGVTAQIFMKFGMNDVGKIDVRDLVSMKIFNIVFNKFVFVGIALYGISSLLYLVAISMEDVSFVYPLIGIGYILTAVLAWLFFKENVTIMRITGIVLISAGAYLVVLKR